MKEADFVAISLICMFVAAFVTGLVLEVPLSFDSWFDNFVLSIEWQAIIIIMSMSIISKIAQDSNVLEYLAVKIFKISKGNQRYFFYLICVITTLLAAVISDVVVVIILAPVVVRLCHFKNKSGNLLIRNDDLY